MRFTTEQRLLALERENVVLHNTTKLLHQMLKEQRQLINDYIIQSLTATDINNEQDESARLEEAIYTFNCKQRFDRLEKSLEKLCKQMDEAVVALDEV
jgi:hypothetical protein